MLNDLNKKKIVVSVILGGFFVILSILVGNNVAFAMASGVIAGVCGYFIPAFIEKRKEEERKKSFELDMPDFLNHIAMLLNAGVNIWAAIDKASSMGNADRPLYKELGKMKKEMGEGVRGDMAYALERMAERCGASSIASFVSLVVQNSRKGNGEIAELFRIQSGIYREQRKNLIGKMADEASTLLVIPSAMVLIGIMIMMIAPAILEIMKI